MDMVMSAQATFLQSYVSKQAAALFPDGYALYVALQDQVEPALRRVRSSVAASRAWREEGFDYLVSGQYAIFLYYLAHGIWCTSKNRDAATRLFLLNKAINGIDLFYEIEMPNYFLVGHTVGMVFSKASYADYLVMHQGCTIGRSGDERPVLEPGVVLYPNSAIIGRCKVRENTVLTPGVQLVNRDTPGNCYVFPGERGQPVFKEIDEYYIDRIFDRSGHVQP